MTARPDSLEAGLDSALIQALAGAESIHVLDDASAAWLTRHRPGLRLAADGERADLALGLAALAGLDGAAANALLFRARTWLAPAVIVALPAAAALDAAALRALAFEPFAEAGGVSLWQFRIATYKPAPDWLNARYWAHPERWQG